MYLSTKPWHHTVAEPLCVLYGASSHVFHWTALTTRHPNLVADTFKALAQTALPQKRLRLSSEPQTTH